MGGLVKSLTRLPQSLVWLQVDFDFPSRATDWVGKKSLDGEIHQSHLAGYYNAIQDLIFLYHQRSSRVKSLGGNQNGEKKTG